MTTFNEILNWEIPVLITNINRRILFVNQFWMQLYGANSEDILDHKPSVMKSGMTARSVYDDLNSCLCRSGAWSGVLINRHLKDKGYLIISLTIMKLEVEGQIVYVSLHQPLDQLSLESVVSIGSLQTVEGLFLQSIAKIAEWNDPELEGHVYRVAKLARWIAKMAYREDLIPETDVDWIEAASVVHDIGKAAIAKEILFKPDVLTNSERLLVNDHASIGGEMIKTLYEKMKSYHSLFGKLFEYARDSALTHHEWWDGQGYPNGLKGESIPMVGRIVTLADVIDALLSNRPYKKAWTLAKVKEYLLEKNAKQFDPTLVNLIIRAWDEIYRIYDIQNNSQL